MNIFQSIQHAVKEVVGSCYPITVPEKPDIPYAVYMQVSNTPEVTVENTIPIESSRVQVDVYAKTYAESQDLGGRVRDALMAIGAIPLSAGDLYESDVKLYRVTQDFSVWFQK
jgi:hypothetical protein